MKITNIDLFLKPEIISCNNNLLDNNSLIVITRDSLVMPKRLPLDSEKDYEILIEGIFMDEGKLLHGPSESMLILIDTCFNAVDNHKQVKFELDCGTIIKFNY